jgi:hypothetical protein
MDLGRCSYAFFLSFGLAFIIRRLFFYRLSWYIFGVGGAVLARGIVGMGEERGERERKTWRFEGTGAFC